MFLAVCYWLTVSLLGSTLSCVGGGGTGFGAGCISVFMISSLLSLLHDFEAISSTIRFVSSISFFMSLSFSVKSAYNCCCVVLVHPRNCWTLSGCCCDRYIIPAIPAYHTNMSVIKNVRSTFFMVYCYLLVKNGFVIIVTLLYYVKPIVLKYFCSFVLLSFVCWHYHISIFCSMLAFCWRTPSMSGNF